MVSSLFEFNVYALKWIKSKAAGVKVYPRQTWNFRAHAVSACISLWRHKTMHAVHAKETSPISMVHACICLCCMHQPVTSRADHMVAACTYCMGSKVSSLSRIYLYSSYFDKKCNKDGASSNLKEQQLGEEKKRVPFQKESSESSFFRIWRNSILPMCCELLIVTDSAI